MPSSIGRVAPCLLLVATSSSLVAQTSLWEVTGVPPSPQANWAFTGGHDLDGDGVGDLVSGAYDHTENGDEVGAARAYSGADGTLLATWLGSADLDRFGFAVAMIEDLDGDEHGEVVVGAFGADAGGVAAGEVVVFSGLTQTVLHRVIGSSGDGLGYAIANAGDVDADGFDDIIASAPTANGSRGRVDVISGRTGGVVRTFTGSATGAEFGYVVAGIGDLDGDRFADVAISSTGGVGRVDVFSGRTGAPLLAITASSTATQFGAAVAAIGDVDGDGTADLAIGEPLTQTSGTTGRVFVVSGATGNGIRVIARRHTDTATFGSFGFGSSITPIGDLDLDRVPDFAVGFGWYTEYPATVLSGADGSIIFALNSRTGGLLARRANVAPIDHGDGDGPRFAVAAHNTNVAARIFAVGTSFDWQDRLGVIGGPEFSAVGDLDADGAEDYMQIDRPAGTMIAHSGRTRTRIVGFPILPYGNQHPVRIGDTNGDGNDDFAYVLSNVFDVALISGADGRTIRTHPVISSSFSARVASAGDVNADGYADVIVGSIYTPTGPVQSGEATVYSGINGSILFRVTGSTAFERVGGRVSGVGDIDRDGHDDFFIQRNLTGRADGTIYSGATSARLAIQLALEVTAAGDVNGDGQDDVLLVGDSEITIATGANLLPLRTWNPGQLTRTSVATAADLDRDGWLEVAVTLPFEPYPISPGRLGLTRVFSSRTGAALWQNPINSRLNVTDLDGDGISEFVGSQTFGEVDVFGFHRYNAFPDERNFGVACASGSGSRPRGSISDTPYLGAPVELGLRGAPSNAVGALIVSVPAPPLPLDLLGAPGCTAYFGLESGSIPITTNATGMASIAWTIDSVPIAVGAEYVFQWFALDSSLAGIGLTASDGHAVKVGGRVR